MTFECTYINKKLDVS